MLYLRIVLLSVCLFFVFNSFGQAPGYLGKRIFFEGNLGINASRSLKPIAKISANFVVKRHKYISIEARYQQFSSSQDSLLTFAGLPALKYRISTQSVGIGFFKTKKRNLNSLAPIGFFFGYKFNFSRSFVEPIKYADTNDRFGGVEKAAYNLKYINPQLIFFGFSISSGFRTVLKDKFTLSYALDLGYDLPISLTTYVDRQFAFSEDLLTRKNSAFLRFSIGVGILL